MSGPLNLDYFYGIQADQFEYYRIPKLLVTDKRYNGISSDAKILYGVLLDRMSLSLKNKWIDEQNRVFIIYSIKEICKKLECSKDKAMYVMAELDNSKGIGLIEKAKRGLGLPDIIYVKNFATLENKNIVRPAKKPTIPVKKKQEGNKTDAYKCQVRYGKARKEEVVESQYQEVEDIPHPEVGNLQPPEVANLQPPEVANLRPPEVANLQPPEVANLRPQRWQISDPNNNYINNNNINNSDVNNPFLSFHFQDMGDVRTEWNGTDSSAPIELVMEKRKKINSDFSDLNDAVSDKARESDVLMMKEKYVRLLKKQVFYDDLMKMDKYKFEKPTIDGIINMIADIATTVPPDNTEWINSRPYNHEVVKSHMLKLDYHSLLDALRRIISSDAKILYGVLLDRMSLSLKNRWIDEQNRVFIIYSIKEICEKLECSKDKAMYVMAELDNVKGIGLIEKAKRGLGLPDIIYVKNFATLENKSEVKPAPKPTVPIKKKQKENKTDAYKCQVRYGKARGREVVKSQYQEVEDIQYPEVANLRPPEVANLRPPEVANLQPPEVANLRPQRWQISDPNNNYINNNNNNINNSDVNNPFPSFHFQNTGDGRTEWNGTDSSAPIELVMEKRKKINSDYANRKDAMSDKARESDVLMMKEKYVRLLKKQVFYDDLMKMDKYKFEKPTIDGIINMIADIATTVPPDNTEWINSRPYNHEVVKSHMLKLDYHSLLDALRRIKNNNTNVHKHRPYLLTTVYNAIDQHDFALSCEVQYDSYRRFENT